MVNLPVSYNVFLFNIYCKRNRNRSIFNYLRSIFYSKKPVFITWSFRGHTRLPFNANLWNTQETTYSCTQGISDTIPIVYSNTSIRISIQKYRKVTRWKRSWKKNVLSINSYSYDPYLNRGSVQSRIAEEPETIFFLNKF